MTPSLRRTGIAAAILLLASLPAAASADQPGDLWEITSQMSMEGVDMKFPANTMKVCSPKEWKEPPRMEGDRNCRTTDFKAEGNKVTWSVTCEGMTGRGEITRTAETFSGTMQFSSEEGNMTIKVDGRRLGGCDNPQ